MISCGSRMKYYHNCLFFKITRNFIAQTGDPQNDGQGGSSVYGYAIALILLSSSICCSASPRDQWCCNLSVIQVVSNRHLIVSCEQAARWTVQALLQGRNYSRAQALECWHAWHVFRQGGCKCLAVLHHPRTHSGCTTPSTDCSDKGMTKLAC